jgi:hypothetical protein
MIHKSIQQAMDAKLDGDYHYLEMSEDKQQSLKKITDADKDSGNDKAYKAACAFYATILNLETLSGKDLDIEALFYKCVEAGAISKASAYINSYEKIAAIAGVPVKRIVSKYIKGNENEMRDLLRAGVPLIIFIGAPNDLDHVEACFGFITTADESFFFVSDPGYQNDTMIAGDLKMFHFENGKRKHSVWKNNVERKAYKFAFYET